jgi:DNA transformation protein
MRWRYLVILFTNSMPDPPREIKFFWRAPGTTGSRVASPGVSRWRGPLGPLGTRRRGTLDPFVEFILDQLAPLRDVRARRMFGANGLYLGGRFFGIVAQGRLYLRTAPDTRQPYLDAGMGPFEPNPGRVLKNYFEVPVEVIEDDSELSRWALAAVESGDPSKKPRRGDRR